MKSLCRLVGHLVCRCFLVSAVVLTMIPVAVAQAGAGCGTVPDQSGAVIVGAGFNFRTSGRRLAAKSGASGRFCFEHVQSGDYELLVQVRGFKRDVRRMVLNPGQNAVLNILLTVESASQQVTVVEGAADVSSLNVAQT